MTDDLRHFHLSWSERLLKWLSECGDWAGRWADSPSIAGLTRGQVLLIAILAVAITVDIGERLT